MTGLGVMIMAEGVVFREVLLNLDSVQTLLSATLENGDILLPCKR